MRIQDRDPEIVGSLRHIHGHENGVIIYDIAGEPFADILIEIENLGSLVVFEPEGESKFPVNRGNALVLPPGAESEFAVQPHKFRK